MSQDLFDIPQPKHQVVPASTRIKTRQTSRTMVDGNGKTVPVLKLRNVDTDRMIRRLHFLKRPDVRAVIAQDSDGRPAIRHYAREVHLIERALVQRGVLDPFAYEYREGIRG